MSVSKANPLGNHLEITDSSKCLKVPDKIGIIGLGLIGGTLAKTIHRIYPDLPLIACDTDSKALASALKEGVIRQGFPGIDESFANCRYIFLCAPVEKNETFLSALAPFLSERCILTDTGSVKASIHEDMRRRGLSSFFIGGHPMAGSEKSGYENATPYLFENAYYIITNDGAAPALVAEYRNFIASLGCIPLLMSPREHDYATAAVSHLPHILASSLVNLVKDLDDDQESMKTIAAGGFRDITRIASSSPEMWQEICGANREEILLLLDQFIEALTAVRGEIASKNREKILDFFRQARDYRDSLPIRSSGPLPSIFEIYCDLIDEAGGIATIATILATNAISIKNIGIIHNREFEDGVLRIEFYDGPSRAQAALLLRRHHYIVYER